MGSGGSLEHPPPCHMYTGTHTHIRTQVHILACATVQFRAVSLGSSGKRQAAWALELRAPAGISCSHRMPDFLSPTIELVLLGQGTVWTLRECQDGKR